jgi:hypothetical protein
VCTQWCGVVHQPARLAHLLSVDLVHAVCKAQLLEHQVAARLQQLAHDAIWLTQVALEQQNLPASLQCQRNFSSVIVRACNNDTLLQMAQKNANTLHITHPSAAAAVTGRWRGLLAHLGLSVSQC